MVMFVRLGDEIAISNIALPSIFNVNL